MPVNGNGVASAPDGSVLIADTGNDRVLRVTGDGKRIEVVAGTGKMGSELVEDNPTRTQLKSPGGVVVARPE